MKTGLVLEGGAMRGLFTAGVIDVWMEAGVRFDGLVGVSAGACFGCNYKSRQPGRVIRYNTRFAKDPRYCSWWSLFRTGDIFNAEFCYHTLPEELDPFDAATFESDPMEFHLSVTDAKTGKPVYRKIDKVDADAFEWIRASASMPLVSRPVLRAERGDHDAAARLPQVPVVEASPGQAVPAEMASGLHCACHSPRMVQPHAGLHRRARGGGGGAARFAAGAAADISRLPRS